MAPSPLTTAALERRPCSSRRSGNSDIGPWTYTVGSGDQAQDTYSITGAGLSGYDLSVFGLNGFFRAFRGSLNGSATVQLGVHASYQQERIAVTLSLANHGSQSTHVDVMNGYSGKSIGVELRAGQSTEKTF
jgi:phospholipase C